MSIGQKENSSSIELYLHIGTHKTGTTSIQKMMATNDSWFREKQSILYPRTGRPNTTLSNRYGQHELAWSLRGVKNFRSYENWELLQQEATNASCRAVVLSTEDFEQVSEEEIQKLKSFTCGFGNTRAIVYLRNPSGALLAKYKQRVKSGKLERRSLADFAKAFLHCLDYGALINRWESALGAGQVIVKSFDYEVRTRGLERGFASILTEDLAGLKIPEKKANASPSDLSTRLARHINSGIMVFGPSSQSGEFLKRIKSRVLRIKISRKLTQTFHLDFKPEQCVPNFEELCFQQRQALKLRLTPEELDSLFPWIGE